MTDSRPPGRRRRISVDASTWTPEPENAGAYLHAGLCGIAAVLDGGRDVRVLFADVGASAGSSMDEWMALSKAMEIAEKASWTQVVFRSDASGIRRRFHDSRPPPGWTLEVVPRAHNTAAHTVASQALKLWIAGRENRLTI